MAQVFRITIEFFFQIFLFLFETQPIYLNKNEFKFCVTKYYFISSTRCVVNNAAGSVNKRYKICKEVARGRRREAVGVSKIKNYTI